MSTTPPPRLAFFPRAMPWLHAALLFLFFTGFGTVAALAMEVLLRLSESAPRLMVLGFLGLWLSPIAAIALVHRVGHAVLDGADKSRARDGSRARAGVMSLWAGVFAWLTMFAASVVGVFTLLVINPPELGSFASVASGGRALLSSASPGFAMSAQAVAWVLAAALLYQLEARMKATKDR